jgi:hypothetical protein
MFAEQISSVINRNRRKLHYVAIFFLLSVGICIAYKKLESNWYRSFMPTEIELGDTLLIDGKSGFREGCGVAIFELTSHMRKRINVHGLASLDGMLHQKAQTRSKLDLSLWTETPYVETGDGTTLEDTWAVGLSCADTDNEMVREITRALRQPGSFVKKLDEAAIVVMPASGMAALVYSD